MELKEVKKGLFLKKTIRYDENHFELVTRSLQFPIKEWRWCGFIEEKESVINFDESIHYFKHNTWVFGKKHLFIVKASEYDKLPVGGGDLADDDKDDLQFENLPDEMRKEKKDAYVEDLYLRTSTLELNWKEDVIEEIFSFLEKSSANLMTAKKLKGVLRHSCLAWDETWAIHAHVSSIFKNIEFDSVPIGLMAFFIQTKGLWRGVYCGYHRQLNAKGLSESTSKKFYNWCLERAPRLTAEGEKFKSSIWPKFYNPVAWFYRDHLVLTPEAFVYTRKTFGKDEMVYLPYARTRMLLLSSGIFTKKIEIYGEQNIIPKFSFSTSLCKKIVKIAKEKGVNQEKGESFTCNMLLPKNWFGRSPRLVLTENGIIYYPNRIESFISKETGMKMKVINVNYREITKVDWFKPYFWMNGTLVIHGNLNNLRQDQSSKSVYMLMPSVLKFKYKYFLFFSGKLRNILKSHTCDNIIHKCHPQHKL